MATTKAKVKRRESISPPSPIIPANIISGLFECFNFISPNDYSNRTLGILAFLVRKSVGDINFSDIMDEIEKLDQQGQPADFVKLLDDRRISLSDNDASIEKCLMLNRLITYFEQNKSQFLAIVSDIRLDMMKKLSDQRSSPNVDYPKDFRQREEDFNKRKCAQNVRRLFYFSDRETREPPSLVYLINKTTEQLHNLIDSRIRYDASFRETGLKELDRLFSTSFMITVHPHSGAIPVTIYDRCGSGQCRIKINFTIVSLLHDFMQTHPGLIELYDIEFSLCSKSSTYKVDPSTIPWKTCRLQLRPNDRVRCIQYVDLAALVIQCSTQANARIHLGEDLYTFKFNIRLRLNLPEFKFTKTFQIPLESSPFGIASHNSYVAHLLTRVILNDVRQFSKNGTNDIQQLQNGLVRFFCHRTGVSPTPCFQSYLKAQLEKAKEERKNFQTMEDIFMEFIVPLLNQIDFMGKHPILSMFYADGLFFGTCNSEQVAEIMKKTSNLNSPIIALRLNSLKIDYTTSTATKNPTKSIRTSTPAVRVDIYNPRTQLLQHRTFNSGTLAIDIKKFVVTANKNHPITIRILSNLDETVNIKNYKEYKDFNNYFYERLNTIHVDDCEYKPITNLFNNIEECDDDEDQQATNQTNADMSEMFPDNLHPVSPSSTIASTTDSSTMASYAYDDTTNLSVNSVTDPNSVTTLLQNINNQDMVNYILSKPDLLSDLFNKLGMCLTLSPQQQQQELSHQQHFQYSNPNSVIADSPYNQYQYPCIPTNHFPILSREASTDSDNPQIYNDLFNESIDDSLQLLTTDQRSAIPIDDSLEQYLNSEHSHIPK